MENNIVGTAVYGTVVGHVGPDTRFAPWWWQNDDPNTGVVEVGGGLVQGMAEAGFYADHSPWEDFRLQVVRIVFTDPDNTVGSFNLTSLFRNLPNLVEIDNIDYININDTRWFSNMFRDSGNLQHIVGLENWDTSGVRRFTSMFRDTNFVTLDLSTFDTSGASRLDSMFRDASHLQQIIGIETFNTGEVTTFAHMFRGTNLLSLDLSHWNTSSLTAAASGEGISGTFRDMRSLESLDISSWDTRFASASQMQQTFAGSTALRVLTLGENWTVPSGASGLGLPPVPTNSSYAGLWQNVAGGTIDHPQGELFYTSQALMTGSNGAGNTWVWARALLTVTFESSMNGELVPAQPHSVELAAETTLAEADVSIPVPTPKAGYKFAYWSSPQYPGVRFTRANLLALPIVQNTTFIAMFAPAAVPSPGRPAQPLRNGSSMNNMMLWLLIASLFRQC